MEQLYGCVEWSSKQFMYMTFLKKPVVQAGFLLGFVAIALLGTYGFGVQNLTPGTLQRFIAGCGWWGPVVYIVLYTIRPLIFFPALIFNLASGLLFGPWWGTIYLVMGGSFGACLCFGITRLLGQKRCAALWGKSLFLQNWNEHAAESGFRTILMMRVVPLFPYDIVSYASGLSKVKFTDYAAATMLGMLPGAFAYNLLGYSLTDLFSPTFFLALGAVALVLVGPLLYTGYNRRKARVQNSNAK